MYALTKFPVARETAQLIAAAHLDERAAIQQYTELSDGMYNAAYLIELTDGRRAVLKVAPPEHVRVLRYEKNILRAEVEVLRLVGAQTEVPVPAVLAYDTSRRLIDTDYCLLAYIPGVSLHKLRPHLTAADQHALDFRTGEYLRCLHTLAGPAFGYFAQPALQLPTWRAALTSMFEHLLQDGREAGVELPCHYPDLAARWQAASAVLDEVPRPTLVHWDLWDGNIFVDPETRQITGLLDWERAVWADPLMEVNFGAFGLNPAVVEGYGADLLATPAAQLRRTLYNIYLWLIMIIECTYRRYETKAQEDWARLKLIDEMEKLPPAETAGG